jgi:hypothetical protein
MKFNLATKLYQLLVALPNDFDNYLNAKPCLNRKLGFPFYTQKGTQNYLQHFSLLCNGNEIKIEYNNKSLLKEREAKAIFYFLFISTCSIIYGVLQSDKIIVILIQALKYFLTLYFFFYHNIVKSYFIVCSEIFNARYDAFEVKCAKNHQTFETFCEKENTIHTSNCKSRIFSSDKIEEIEYVIVEQETTQTKNENECEKSKVRKIGKKQVYKTSAKFYCLFEYYVSKYEKKDGFVKFGGNTKEKIAKQLFSKYNQSISLDTFKAQLKENDSRLFYFMYFNIIGKKKISEQDKIDFTSNYFAENGHLTAKKYFDKDYNLLKVKSKKIAKEIIQNKMLNIFL